MAQMPAKAALPVPEVLFLRPSHASGGTATAVSPLVQQRPTSASGPRSVRSVRDVLGELRRQEMSTAEETRQVLSSNAIGSISLDPAPAEPPRPHFRSTATIDDHFLRELSSAASVRKSVDKTMELNWPAIVGSLVAHNQLQWQAIRSNLAGYGKVGIIGLEQRCGTTTFAAALVQSLAQCPPDHPASYNPLSQNPLVLIDGNLERPGLGALLDLNDSEQWIEWTTVTVPESAFPESTVPGSAVPSSTPRASLIRGAALPGNDQIRLWPLTCAISNPACKSQSTEAQATSCDATRYYLPVQAVGPITQSLTRVIRQVAREGHQVFVDLGHVHFWKSLMHLNVIAKIFDRIIVVVPPSPNRRHVSQVYWELQDAGQKSCFLVENSYHSER
jgi:hypothetical protein